MSDTPLRFVLSRGCEFSRTDYYALPNGWLLKITDHRSCDMPRDCLARRHGQGRQDPRSGEAAAMTVTTAPAGCRQQRMKGPKP